LRKKFITNIALLLFLNLLIKPFWMFGIDRTVQVMVGAGEYGYYFSLLNLSLILNILLDAGLTNFNNKNIAQYSQLLSKHFSNLVVLKFILAIIYLIVVLIVGLSLNYHWQQMKLLLVLAFNQFLLSFIMYLRSNLSGLHKFKSDSFISVLDRLLMIVICSFLLWGNIAHSVFKIEWFVYAQTLAYIVTSVIAFLLVFRNLSFFKPRFDYTFLRVIVRQSYPYAFLVLLMSVYNRIDGVMLERMLPDSTQSGIYAHAFRVLDAASMFAYLFAGILLPIFARMIKINSDVGQLVKLSFLLLIVPSLAVAINSFFFANQIMALLYEEHIQQSADVFKILILGFIPIASNYIFGTLLTAAGKLKYLNIMAGIAMLVNISLNFILIPHLFAYGAAIASLFTQSLMAVFQIFVSVKVFRFKINRLPIILLFINIASIILLANFSDMLPIKWWATYIILIFANLITASVTKLISIKNIFYIVRNDGE